MSQLDSFGRKDDLKMVCILTSLVCYMFSGWIVCSCIDIDDNFVAELIENNNSVSLFI